MRSMLSKACAAVQLQTLSISAIFISRINLPVFGGGCGRFWIKTAQGGFALRDSLR